MNKKARKWFNRLVKAGFTISVWRDKKRRKFACEITRPKWSGSCVENGPSISKAVIAAARSAKEEEVMRALERVSKSPKTAASA